MATTIGPVTTTADARSQSGPAPRAGHVVLVARDGFDARYLQRGVPTPNLDALAARGQSRDIAVETLGRQRKTPASMAGPCSS